MNFQETNSDNLQNNKPVDKNVKNNQIKEFFNYYQSGFFWLLFSMSPLITLFLIGLVGVQELLFIPFGVLVAGAISRWLKTQWLPKFFSFSFRSRLDSPFVEQQFDFLIARPINFVVKWVIYIAIWWIMEFFIQVIFLIRAIFLWRSHDKCSSRCGLWPNE